MISSLNNDDNNKLDFNGYYKNFSGFCSSRYNSSYFSIAILFSLKKS